MCKQKTKQNKHGKWKYKTRPVFFCGFSFVCALPTSDTQSTVLEIIVKHFSTSSLLYKKVLLYKAKHGYAADSRPLTPAIAL